MRQQRQLLVADVPDHTGVHGDPATPQLTVKVPDTNTKIEVVREYQGGRVTAVRVGPAS